MGTETELGIQVDPELGFPYLEFTCALGAEVSNERLYEMFVRLPQDQAELIKQSQAALYDGKGMMDLVKEFAKKFGRKRTIYTFDLDPEAVEVLAEYGEPYIGKLLPPRALMERGKCTRNSLKAATQYPGHAYVEGLALPPVGLIMHHAWCADGARGFNQYQGGPNLLAIDYTWARADYARYFGIWIDKDAMTELMAIVQSIIEKKRDPGMQMEGFLYHKIWCPEIRKVFEENAKRQRA